ncbi:hypothetical protein [Algibacter lectus]|uniref:Uncharacterized protein n=1 Tax=Algibacter lectus TaxID=221126 RepID=A0A090VK49_9FLAO|nr:hypothetical protein [Algibacter lectus]GAL65125.1 hypothetical protein JCM19300_408 [Algibacter lectus]
MKENHPEVLVRYDGKREISDVNEEWYEFLGKRAGRIKCKSKNAQKKCEEFLMVYKKWQEKAKSILEIE